MGPKHIIMAIPGPVVAFPDADYLEDTVPHLHVVDDDWPAPHEIPATLERLKKEMKRAAAALEFERAAELRDRIHILERHRLGVPEAPRA
jgi:excinuclease ABC subunit B